MNEPTTRNRIVRAALAALALAAATLAAAAAPAAAHECASNTHEGCDGHNCPDDGASHNHVTVHPWSYDHYCNSRPIDGVADLVPCGSAAAGGSDLNVGVELPDSCR